MRMPARLVILALLAATSGCAHIPETPQAASPGGAPQNAAVATSARPEGSPVASPLGNPFAETPARAGALDTPLMIDRTDLRIGTTVQFRHIPNASELHDLSQLPGLARVVLSFESWPAEYAPLQVLNQAPEGVEVVAILPGWPPNRAAVDAWNYLQVRLRVIVIVPGPPPSIDRVTNLNEMRGLERVIAQMDDPSRQGFERLQRPLSFRKLIN